MTPITLSPLYTLHSSSKRHKNLFQTNRLLFIAVSYRLLLFYFIFIFNTQTPIDELDAASRVLDPIIAPLLAQQRGEIVDPPWGFFLKDYQKCEW